MDICWGWQFVRDFCFQAGEGERGGSRCLEGLRSSDTAVDIPSVLMNSTSAARKNSVLTALYSAKLSRLIKLRFD